MQQRYNELLVITQMLKSFRRRDARLEFKSFQTYRNSHPYLVSQEIMELKNHTE